MKSNLRYFVVENGLLRADGEDIIIAGFEFKAYAAEWVRAKYGSKWRSQYKIVKPVK